MIKPNLMATLLSASVLALTGITSVCVADTDLIGEFEQPVRLSADGKYITVGDPGYAAPTLHDTTGDGLPDLLVGQFDNGAIGVYAQLEGGGFTWHGRLQADGEDVSIPGIW